MEKIFHKDKGVKRVRSFPSSTHRIRTSVNQRVPESYLFLFSRKLIQKSTMLRQGGL